MSPEEWYKSLPLVTKVFFTVSVAFTILISLKVLSPIHLYLDFDLVLSLSFSLSLFTLSLFSLSLSLPLLSLSPYPSLSRSLSHSLSRNTYYLRHLSIYISLYLSPLPPLTPLSLLSLLTLSLSLNRLFFLNSMSLK